MPGARPGSNRTIQSLPSLETKQSRSRASDRPWPKGMGFSKPIVHEDLRLAPLSLDGLSAVQGQVKERTALPRKGEECD
ncbi:MAG: hypothetical protein RLZZ117_2728 [Cyanobacteriota bacterium]